MTDESAQPYGGLRLRFNSSLESRYPSVNDRYA